MTKPTAAAIRQQFLDYFARHGHTVVRSSPLIPGNDPTLMFTNAGMVQFKDVFTGAERRPYTRATSSQKCMRVSGKHNDLEEVGRTARHHTFFEMLGNFSFGDYFKAEAIELAWRFVTAEVGLPADRLWVTVFGGEAGLPADGEARALWRKVSGLPEARILDKGMKENFWAMGDTGPCGPCTEIHYDLGGDGPPTEADFDSGRVVEIWNNVFMQFERRAGGELVPLPRPSVDTGMGLERLAAVLQGETSNYHTDLFTPILATIAEAVGKPYRRSASDDDVSMRVIADHARATAFLVADGLQPGNEGRGYVLRRIMRRAIRHGKRLGFDALFFHRACAAVIDTMQAAYPELGETRTLCLKVAENEERSFRRTLEAGLRRLGDDVAAARRAGGAVLPGQAVFRLYDTYGFPKDLTEVIAAEQGLQLDEAGFAAAMEAQQARSRSSAVGDEAIATIYKQLADQLGKTTFVGYAHEETPLAQREGTWRAHEANGARYLETRCQIRALVTDGARRESVDEGLVEVVLEPTPFYGEAGGQVGDRGIIVGDDGLYVEVLETIKPVGELTLCRGRVLAGALRVGVEVWAGYEAEVRRETRAHHSATHLLHGALRAVLGDHVKQQGSLVDPEHLRFDYAHFEAPTAAQLGEVERRVNGQIAADHPVATEVLAFTEAKRRGAIALFGEKYGETVRMVSMGASIELCGGTHAGRTGELELLLVTNEEAVASGIRRIEAVVGRAARAEAEQCQRLLERAAALLAGATPIGETDHPVLLAVRKAVRQRQELDAALGQTGAAEARPAALPPLRAGFGWTEASRVRDLWRGLAQCTNARGTELDELVARYAPLAGGALLEAYVRLVHGNREAERRLEQAERARLSAAAGDLLDGAREVAGVRLLATRIEGADAKALRELADKLRDRLASGVLCLGSAADGRANLLVAVTADLTGRFQAGKLIQELAPLIGGRGGGKAELAQAGGTRPEALESAFTRIAELVGQAR